jgi:hypothetical protein
MGSVSSTPAGIACGMSCSRGFDVGTRVTLTATPEEGWRFAGWSGGGCTGTGPCTLTLLADTTIGATFTQLAAVSSPSPPTSAAPSTPAAFGSKTLVRLRLARQRIRSS